METTWTTNSELVEDGATRRRPQVVALVVIWSRDEPSRVGEVLLPASAGVDCFLGRGAQGSKPRLRPIRQRPGHNRETGPLTAKRISRDQLRVRPVGDTLELENLGRRTLLVDGHAIPEGTPTRVREGDVVELRGELMLLVASRPFELPAAELPAALVPEFGRADGCGVVGESPLAWELRARIAFAAERNVHVFVGGPSGTGKELVAQAIHRLSERGARTMVSRNAATLPEGLIDAELFGNAADYPNPGMVERPGLIGAAHLSTLFLDEIGELPTELQAHLLRVLDQGEYQRLGEAKLRRADVRLIAATNRDTSELKHDLIARLRLRIETPGLEVRREDIALLVPHIVERIAREDPGLAERFYVGEVGPEGRPRVDPAMIRSLHGRGWETHVRELEGLLWTAMMDSAVHDRDQISLGSDELDGDPAQVEVDPATLSPAEIVEALERAQWVQDRAWRLLGLRSRYQLVRLIKKHDIEVKRRAKS